jgi:hypothetical protein
VNTLVLVGDVEEAAVVGDRYAFDTRQGRELTDEFGFEGARVPVRRERAAEVGCHRVLDARIVLSWTGVRECKQGQTTEVFMERNQAEEMIRAADRFAEATRELTKSIDRFLEYQEYEYGRTRGRGERLPGDLVLGLLGAGGLSDEEAGKLAHEAVHKARRELGRTGTLPTPGPEEIKAWEQRREERRRREGY